MTHHGITGSEPAGGRHVHVPADELLTVPEVLEELQVARATWYRWRQTGRGPRAIRLPNGELRVRRTALTEWLQDLEEPDDEEPD
jgi:predicted DNA-binding transcriptional regulator AlpA